MSPRESSRLAPGHLRHHSRSSPPARGERVWDAELKRYLTEQEMAHAEVFLTHKDAVFKFSYRFNNRKDTSPSNFVNNPRNSQTTRIDGNGFLFMAATYF